MKVEQAFRRRHNEQVEEIRRLGGDLPGPQRVVLEQVVRRLRDELDEQKAS